MRRAMKDECAAEPALSCKDKRPVVRWPLGGAPWWPGRAPQECPGASKPAFARVESRFSARVFITRHKVHLHKCLRKREQNLNFLGPVNTFGGGSGPGARRIVSAPPRHTVP